MTVRRYYQKFLMQLFGPSFEVRGLFVFMLSVISLCVAVLVYWNVQSRMQDDLVTAYRKADDLIHDLVRHKGGLLEFVHLTSVVHDPATSTCAVGVG